jgi:uncharacterized membrane protein YdjX (TVP38/TMEM64 family)
MMIIMLMIMMMMLVMMMMMMDDYDENGDRWINAYRQQLYYIFVVDSTHLNDNSVQLTGLR